MLGYATYEVRNQPPLLDDCDAWATDLLFRIAVSAFGARWAVRHLRGARWLIPDSGAGEAGQPFRI